MNHDTYSRSGFRSHRSAVGTPRRWRAVLAGALLTILLLPVSVGHATDLALEPGEFDPTAWNDLLDRFVGEEGVDYAAWSRVGTEELDAFLAAAATYDLGSVLGKEPRVAFLINAYNAWAVRQILDHYPVASVKDIPGFFDANTVKIAGEERTLDAMEASVAAIMPHSPQMVFGLAPGARGFPPLAPVAYTAANHLEVSGVAGKVFMTVAHPVVFDPESGEVQISPLVERYREHIEEIPGGMPRFLAGYLSLQDMMNLSRIEPVYVVTPPDWSLNDSSPRGKSDGK